METRELYSVYRHVRGEMTEEQFERVHIYDPNESDYQRAREIVESVNGVFDNGEDTINLIAKIVGVAGENEAIWIRKEAFLLESVLALKV